MLFFALALLALISAYPVNLTYPETFPANVTLPEPPLTLNLTAGLRCEQRIQSQFLVEDCFAAVQALYIDHVITEPDKVYEFRPRNTPARTKSPWMQVPILYTVSKRPLASKAWSIGSMDLYTKGAEVGSRQTQIHAHSRY